ncbi:cobyric acid synthase [Halorhabdus sp. CBA1104]|uniref:cobyric acid synthase n=1 Tax=Halorhabdus sp. CBA1104 TaxID=1380432 RepID=UPI0012B2F862|nr:cobyric acid synthase [Halorhabdus sp. CBA1104]QGN07283.1 cobyric acid synthase [Halorhabdus sp. CBA1104]
MAVTLLVAGTASHVGKSTIVAGLCQRLANRGISVAPFKAQNMSNNARVGFKPDAIGERGDSDPAAGDPDAYGEIGISQYVQARAAGVVPTTDHNPVLLKPRGGGQSQLIIDGEAVGHFSAGTYYDEHWARARRAAREAHDRLAARHDVIVAEGAGSIAEINLQDRDLSNVETARFGDAEILLVGDIERGGVFASLYGTLELLPADLRERVAGLAITKFRGDRSLLASGIEAIEERTGVPVVAVLPHDDPGLPEEDSLSLPEAGERGTWGDGDGLEPERRVTIGVPRLPHLSNVADLAPLAREPGVRVTFLPLGDRIGDADALVLPGTKNTVDDLLALQDARLGEAVEDFEGPMVGICGGYQLLGEALHNVGVESTTATGTVPGLGRLPVETEFSTEKRVTAATYEATGVDPIAGVSGSVSGYEIHMGETTVRADVPRPIEPESAASGRVLGTYLHGCFENRSLRTAFLDTVFADAGVERPDRSPAEADPFDAAAQLVEPIDAFGLVPEFEGSGVRDQ